MGGKGVERKTEGWEGEREGWEWERDGWEREREVGKRARDTWEEEEGEAGFIKVGACIYCSGHTVSSFTGSKEILYYSPRDR